MPNVVLCSTVSLCISCLFHVILLCWRLKQRQQRSRAVSGQRGKTPSWDPDGLAQLGLPRFYMMILCIHCYMSPAASNVSTPLCMRVAGTNMCLNKLHVPYDIPAACNVSTPPCMRVAGINLFYKLNVPIDIPAASYVSTPPSMRVAGIKIS